MRNNSVFTENLDPATQVKQQIH